MLKNKLVFASFSVDDLSKTKSFYKKLGLKVEEKYGGLQLMTKGNEPIMIYEKSDHKPATFTILNFLVDDIDKAVDEMTSSGIEFEQYDMGEIKTNDKGIAEQGEDGPKMAWFTDPAGNIIGLIQTP